MVAIRKIENKKIRNATPTEFNGIQFKSKLEAYTYQSLTKAGIEAEYEPSHFTLIPAFVYNDEKIRPMTYKPDFVGSNFIIECKGFGNDSFPLRWKMFKYTLHLSGAKYKLYLVSTRKQVDEMIDKIKKEYDDNNSLL